jgi:peptidoglycan-associated lipoprotein
MIKFLRFVFLITFVIGGYSISKAQYVLLEADKAFNQFNFEKAIDLYEQAYQKKETLHAAERLATCYHLQSDYKQTESWAAIAAGMEKAKPEHILAYAKALHTNAKFSEAKAQYQKYAELDKKADPKQISLWVASCEAAVLWMQNPSKINISNLKDLNSPQSDWGLAINGDAYTFTSDRIVETTASTNKSFLKFDGAKTPSTKTYGWTGNGYLRIYTAKTPNDVVEIFPLNTNTEYHVGAPSFSKQGDEMFFTLTRIPKNLTYVNGKQATVNVEIFTSKKDDGGSWSAPTPFKYNKVNEYSVGDPFLTPDGKRLYFSSNMPGGLGGSDIYFSERDDEGNWSDPFNIRDINTIGNERTPFIDKDDVFYFSTDGRIGMGGLDIFTTRFSVGGITEPKNLGYPINSSQDDFAYIKTSALTGFLSSNRYGGLGNDDMYSFAEQLIINYKLAGNVYNKVTNEPIADALVTLTKDGEAGVHVQTDSSGNFKFNLDKESAYALTAEKTNYRADVSSLTTVGKTKSETFVMNLALEPIVINKPIVLENIYYNFDKSDIRADAAIELDKLVKIMNENPTIWIELGSHTDSRGNDSYNQKLSQKRAESVVKYIISRGIAKNRITAKGYGESMLLNKCANNVKCTVEEHQLNRRTEFKITKQ